MAKNKIEEVVNCEIHHYGQFMIGRVKTDKYDMHATFRPKEGHVQVAYSAEDTSGMRIIRLEERQLRMLGTHFTVSFLNPEDTKKQNILAEALTALGQFVFYFYEW